MKVAIFGCSWTHGVGKIENYLNWPNYLAKMYPTVTFNNYALSSSSILFQVYLLQYVKKHDPADIYIFQITRPERLTYWNDKINLSKHLVPIYKNYNQFGRTIYNYVQACSPHMVHQKPDLTMTRGSIELSKKYYRLINDAAFDLEWKLAIEHVKQNVDFCFLQTEGADRNVLDIPCIEDILTIEKCREWWMDGSHFGPVGLEWVANWVNEQIKDKINAKL